MRKPIYMLVFGWSVFALMMSIDAGAKNRYSEDIDSTIIDRWVEMYDGGDISLANEILTPGFVPHLPPLLGITDREGYLTWIATPGILYPHISIQDLFGAGELLVARGTVSAIWPPAQRYTNTFIVFFRFEGGLIAEEWWDLDSIGVLEQVGQLPPMRSTYEWSAPSLVTGFPGTQRRNMGLVRLAMEAMNTQDLTLMKHFISTDSVYHNVVYPHVRTWDSFAAYLNTLFTAFPDMHAFTEEIFARGDRVAVRLTVTGTQLGSFGDLPPTGRQVSYTQTLIFRIADGRIVETWVSMDALSLMHQLTVP